MIWSIEGWAALAAIVAPAIVLALTVRRWVESVDWRIVGVCLGLSLVALGPAVYREVLPVPVDEVARGFPYRGVVEKPDVGNPLTNDTTRQMLPWMQLVRESFARIEAPLWNEACFSGYPLLGNGQSAPFSPFFLATLFAGLPHQIVSMAGLKLFAALFFGVLLFRREGLGPWAALAGSSVFALSLFQTVYLYYPMTAVTSLLPALLYFVVAVADDPKGHPQRVGLALVTASILAGGHPESALHCALGAALYLLFRLGRARTGWAAVRGAVAPVLAGLLLSAPAWLPFVEQAVHSDRAETLGRHSMTPARPTEEAAVLGHPDRFGNPALGNWHGKANYCVVAPTYGGLALLALALAALAAGGLGIRRKVFILTGAALFLVALGWTPLALLNRVPPLAWAANDRLRFVGVLFIAIGSFSIFGRERRSLRFPAMVGVLGALAVWWISWGSGLEEITALSDVVGILAAVGVGVALIVGRRVGETVVGAAVAALVCLELLVLTRPFNAPCDVAYFRPTLPIVEALRNHAAGESPFRVVGRDWVLLPNAAAHYGLEDIRGSDPMAWRPYLDFFDRIANPKHEYGIRRVTKFPQAGLDFLGVRYVLANPGARRPKAYELVYSGSDGDLWLNPKALPRFFVPESVVRAAGSEEAVEKTGLIADFCKEAVVQSAAEPVHDRETAEVEKIVRSGPGRYGIEVRAGAAAFVVSSLPAVPGWRLEVDGRKRSPVVVNGAFLGVPVEKGDSRIRLVYRPLSFSLALVLAAAGLAMMASGFGFRVAWDRLTRHVGKSGP